MTKKISQEDLQNLQVLKYDCDDAIKNAKLQIQNAQLMWQNHLLKIHLKYGLSENDEFNMQTGEIKIKEKEQNV